MVLVADQHDAEAVAGEPHGFQVHLGDQRTGGVDDIQSALLRLPADRRRHAVGAENGPRPSGHFVQLLDEDRAGFAQFVHHVFVMNDFLADVDRRPVEIERDLDHVDGPDHAGAKTARFEQKYLLVGPGVGRKRL